MYICVEHTKNGTNALYFLTELGRRRIYRQSYPLDICCNPKKKLKLFTYKREKNAQELCDYVNDYYNSSYKVEKLLGDE